MFIKSHLTSSYSALIGNFTFCLVFALENLVKKSNSIETFTPHLP